MIIPKDKQFTEEQLKEIKAIAREFGCSIKPVAGAGMVVYAIIGDERDELMIKRIEGLDYVLRIARIQNRYKLMDKESELKNHKIIIGGKEIGKKPFIIAGHCTIDPKNPSYFLESAHAIKEAGADALRGGVWKPRTSPHSFQGENKSLDIIARAKEETGLPINLEVMDEQQLLQALEIDPDILQIGARNALNYSFLRIVGERTKGKPIAILLKRGMHMGPVEEFILAAEYIVLHGNSNVILCPRGTQPAMTGYRNHPDESITPLLKEKTWAPVIVDPSHSVGRSIYVPHAALSAILYGADGLNIECNIDPKRGIGDDPKQAITPTILKQIIEDAHQIQPLVGKYQVYI